MIDNGDGFVDLLDYRIFKDWPTRLLGVMFGATTAAPEPGSALLVVLAGAVLLVKRRRPSARS